MKRQRIILGLMALISFAVVTISTYNNLTQPYPGHNDFMSRWEGARSFWAEGLNPYGEEASINIQTEIYGRPALEGEDLGLFAYPFYTVFMVYPVAQMDYAWASAIWMTFLEACLLGLLAVSLGLFKWRPRPVMLGALVLWTLLMYFSGRGLLLGQLGHVVALCQVGALWALYKNRDATAGVLLALSTVKPQMGFLLVPLLMLWALRVQRWRFLGGFAISFGALMGLSFLLVPTWLGDWLTQVSLYPSYTELGSPVWIIANYPWLGVDEVTNKWRVFGGSGDIIQLIITTILAVYMLWTWFDVLIRRKSERFLWTVMLTLLMTHLIPPRTATPHYVVFIPVLIFYLREINGFRPTMKSSLYSYAILLVLFVVPWIHFITTVVGEFEHPTLHLPIPILVLILLVFTRQRWWENANIIDTDIS